ncbi:MAG: DUF6020 family protein [Lachnospiraceae bacterium]
MGRVDTQQNAKHMLLSFVGAIAGTITLSQTMAFDSIYESVKYSNSFFSAVVTILLGIVLYQSMRYTMDASRKERMLSVCFSIMISIALVLGKYLETIESIPLSSVQLWLCIVVIATISSVIIHASWKFLDITIKQHSQIMQKENISFFKTFIFFFACFFIVFLAFYPGAFVYDAQDEYMQVVTRNFTSHHPITHVLLLGGIVQFGNKFLGSVNYGIAMYTLFQMGIVAAVLSYIIQFLQKRYVCRKVLLATIVFYGIFPVISLYAICSAKDTLFTMAYLVTILQIVSYFENTAMFLAKKRNSIALILAGTMMMLLRNNGFYAYIVWNVMMVFVWIVLKMKKKKEITRITKKYVSYFFLFAFVTVLLYTVINSGLLLVVNAKTGGKQEILTVPIQQLARVYVNDENAFTEEEKEVLYRYLPKEGLEKYTPRISDSLKSTFDNETFNENSKDFYLLWIKKGIENPVTYINAWLMTSYGYWYPDAQMNVYKGNQVFTFQYKDSSYFGFETELPGVRESKIPIVEELYRKISLELFQQQVPGISMLFSPGFMLWLLVYLICFQIYCKKNRTLLLSEIMILLIGATFLLGPTYLVRYVWGLWILVPINIAFSLNNQMLYEKYVNYGTIDKFIEGEIK